MPSSSASRALELPIQTRAASVVPASIDEEHRTVDVVFSTGAEVRIYDMDEGRIVQTLSMEPKHVRLDRLNGGAPILNAHSRFDVRDVIGVVEKASVDGKAGQARVRFSERAEVEPIWRDVATGVLRNVSVGFIVHKFQDVTPKGERMRHLHAIDWEPMEISMVPIGADPGASVRESERLFSCRIEGGTAARGKKKMTLLDRIRSRLAGEPVQEPSDPGPEVLAERERVQEIRELVALGARSLPGNIGQSLEHELIARGVTIDEARLVILEARAEEDERFDIRSHISVGTDLSGHEHQRELMAQVIAGRGGCDVSDEARQLMGMRLRDMAQSALEAAGERVTFAMSPSRIVERALTISDFPIILADAAGRTLRKAYDAAPAGVRSVARQVTAPDFRTRHRIALSEAPTLKQVNEHGEFHHGALGEAEETYKLDTFGRIIGLSRQAIVNDDLNSFNDLTRRFGTSAAEFEAQQLVDLLTSGALAGPNMSDGNPLFIAAHGNLEAAPGIIDVASLGAARLAMRSQKGLDGATPINVPPRFLLVPAALETTAEKLLADIAPAKASDVNPFTGKFDLVIDPRLDAASSTGWYVVADPNAIDGLEFAYLEDEPGPQTFLREGWNVDGIEIKVRLDFGAGFVDWRGWYSNPGA